MNGIMWYLQQVGLTESRAKALYMLFMNEEATAKDISKAMSISDNKIYGVLNWLEDVELVIHTRSRPKFYRAMDPQYALELLLSKKEGKIRFLQEETKRQLKHLQEIQREKKQMLNASDTEVKKCKKNTMQ